MKKIFSTLIFGLITVLLVGHAVPVLAQTMDKEAAKTIIAEVYPELSPSALESTYQRLVFEKVNFADKAAIAAALEQEVDYSAAELPALAVLPGEVVKKSDTSFVLNFDIENKGEALAGLKPKVVLVSADEEGVPSDWFALTSDELAVGVGETLNYAMTVDIPGYVEGEYKFKVEIGSEAGMVLASAIYDRDPAVFKSALSDVGITLEECHLLVGDESEKYTLKQGVDIAEDESLVLDCAINNRLEKALDGRVFFNTYERSVWGKVVNNEGVDIKIMPGDTSLQIEVPAFRVPQSYEVVTQFTSAGGETFFQRQLRYVARGESATIHEVSLNKTSFKSAEEIVLQLTWTGSADSFRDSRMEQEGIQAIAQNTELSVKILNSESQLCIEDYRSELTPANGLMSESIVLKAMSDCKVAQVQVEIKSKEGRVLSSRVLRYEADATVVPAAVATTSTETTPKNNLTIVIVAAGCLLLLAGIIAYHRSRNVVFGLLLALAVWGGVGLVQVEAVHVPYYIWHAKAWMWSNHTYDMNFTGPTGTNLTYTYGTGITTSAAMTNYVCVNSVTVGQFFTRVWNEAGTLVRQGGTTADVTSYSVTYSNLPAGTYKARIGWTDARCQTITGNLNAPPNTTLENQYCNVSPTSYADYYFTIINPPTITFTSNVSTVDSGDPAVLNWSVSNANSCTASGGWSGSKSVGSGNETVRPAAPTTYTLSCTGDGGTASKSVVVQNPSGTITAGSCGPIAAEGSTCNSRVTWEGRNFLGGAQMLQGTTSRSSALINIAGTNYPVSPDNRTFTLDDLGGRFSVSATASVTCAANSRWITELGRCAALPVITIDSNPDIVRSGNTAPVDITVTSNYELECTLSGGLNETFSHTPPPGTASYNRTTSPLTSAQIVSIECTSSDYPLITSSAETRVEVIPTVQEI